MSKPKLGKFKNFPVVILPDDCPEYIPGQPLPPGAILNTPLPNWVYLAVVALVAIIVLMIGQAVKPSKPSPLTSASTAALTLTPIPGLITIMNLGEEIEISDGVFVSFATFTPTPRTSVIQTPTPANFKISLWPPEGLPGGTITVTLTSDRSAVYSISWDNQPIKNGELDPGSHTVTMTAIAEAGMHEIIIDVIAANTPPARQIFLFEVTP